MNLSDLFHSEVVDSEGQPVGQAQDARLVRDGPPQGGFGPSYRLQGLIVGTGSWGTRLGFDRGTVRGPLPLKTLFRWLHGTARFVDWGLVTSTRDRVIRLSVPKSELPPVPPIPR
jgi:hypothetical protein